MFRFSPVIILTVLLAPSLVFGHYPWFTRNPSAEKDTVQFVFEEGLAAHDGQYLDPFIKDATYWLRTPGKKEPASMKFEEIKKDGKRWLTFSPAAAAPRAIDCYCKWGVYQGKLLHYYARHLDVASTDDLAALARAEKLDFDLVPRVNRDMIEIQVIWQGKPGAGNSVLIFGPQFKTTLIADANGIVRFQPGKGGLYALRTQFIEPDIAGTDKGTTYKGVRQTATLTMTLPIAAAAKAGQ
jgi:hypothetical protein